MLTSFWMNMNRYPIVKPKDIQIDKKNVKLNIKKKGK